MQIQHIGYRIKGFYRVACLGHLWDMTAKDAQQRLEILGFFADYGQAETCDLATIKTPQLARVVQQLNNRPRKCLNMKRQIKYYSAYHPLLQLQG